MLANDVKNARKKAAFLTLLGAVLYEILASLASPRQIAAVFHFHKRDHFSDETGGAYMVALRSLAVDFNFGTALNEFVLTVKRVSERTVTSEAAAISALSMRHSVANNGRTCKLSFSLGLGSQRSNF
nr:uncharacterized protein LOC118879369 [Drosophila suzukii]